MITEIELAELEEMKARPVILDKIRKLAADYDAKNAVVRAAWSLWYAEDEMYRALYFEEGESKERGALLDYHAARKKLIAALLAVRTTPKAGGGT